MPDDRSSGGVAAAVTITKAASSSSSSGGGVKKGPWTAAEDEILMEYVRKHGEGNWNAVQRNSGLKRCGKSCRLRWANHLRPNLRKGPFSPQEERLILELHSKLGNKWARMAAQLPGRTDNEIKNYWNTRIKRRQRAGLPLYPFDIHRPSPPNPHHRLSSSPLSLFAFAAAPLSLSSNSPPPPPKDLAGIFSPSSPQQLHNAVFFFNSPSLQHDGHRLCLKTELSSSQFFSSSELCSSGRNEGLLLDSMLLDSGNVGGDRRGLSFLPESTSTHENHAFVSGNACEASSKLPSTKRVTNRC